MGEAPGRDGAPRRSWRMAGGGTEAARADLGRARRRGWHAAGAVRAVAHVVAVGLVVAACTSGLPPDNEVHFEDIPLPTEPPPAAEQPPGRPEPGLSPLAVASGFLLAMNALAPGVAGLWVAGDARAEVAGWAGTSTIDVYARRSVVEWSEESGSAEVVVRFERQGELVARSDWRPAAGERELTLHLVRDGGEWRVANPPSVPLVAADEFRRLFARAAVYFVASDGLHLTPQPILVRQTASGGDGAGAGAQPVASARVLVERLLLGPRGPAAAVLKTAIPAATRVRDVTIDDGVAAVDLTAPFAEPTGARGSLRVGQVVWTVAQLFGVPQVELRVNGKPPGLIGPDHFNASGRWHPSKPPLDGLIARRGGSDDQLLFTRDGQLTLLSIAGGDPVVVPVAPVGIVRSPTLSPDRSRIAFVVHAGSRDTLWLSSADGRDAAPTALSGQLSEPSWSPDGRQVLVLHAGATGPSPSAARTTLWSVRPDSPLVPPQQLALASLPGGLEPTTLRVSPDGAAVLGVGARPGPGFRPGGGGQLYRGRLTAAGVIFWTEATIAPGFGTVYSPIWAGVAKVAFIAKRGGQDGTGSIWVMDPDGWRPEAVELGTDRDLDLGERLAADPKGDRFVFTAHSQRGATELFTVLRLDATSLRSLTPVGGATMDTDPSLASR